jgi:hypothetical protein
MGRRLIAVAGMILIVGCSAKKSSLLLERQARGPIEEEPKVAQPLTWYLEPGEQTLVNKGVDVTVRYTPHDYLKTFFMRKDLFGRYAGKSPFYPETTVFYVRISNSSPKKIRINPPEFILVDDHGNQYSMVGVDYMTAFADFRTPVASTTRGVLEGASPGYFGFSLPVGKMFASKPQGQFALLQQSLLQPGYLFPGVIYDGLVAFWNPPSDAKKMRLLITNIKTDFDANDLPGSSLEFPFEFSAAAR